MSRRVTYSADSAGVKATVLTSAETRVFMADTAEVFANVVSALNLVMGLIIKFNDREPD